MTTLADVTKYLKSQAGKEVDEYTDLDFLTDYVEELDRVGTLALKGIDSIDAISAVSVMQGRVVEILMAKGELNGKELVFLMDEKFSTIVAHIFKLSVAIAAMEELR